MPIKSVKSLNKLPNTASLRKAKLEQRKFLISLGIDPDRKINPKNFRVINNWWESSKPAAVAQLVEQLICNHQVRSSNLCGGTRPVNNYKLEESKKFTIAPTYNKGGYQVINKNDIKDIGK